MGADYYIIKKLFFNHFSSIIFYHSVWLGFGLFGLRDQVYSHWVQLHSCAKDMTITICPNKPLDRKLGWSVDDVMPRGDGPENLRILKKSQLRLDHWGESWILTVERCSCFFFFRFSTDRDLRHHKMHRTLGWDLYSKNCVSLLASPWIEVVILDITRCTARWGGIRIVRIVSLSSRRLGLKSRN